MSGPIESNVRLSKSRYDSLSGPIESNNRLSSPIKSNVCLSGPIESNVRLSGPIESNVRLSKSRYDLPLFFHAGCAISRQPRDRSPIVESDFDQNPFRQQDYLHRFEIGNRCFAVLLF